MKPVELGLAFAATDINAIRKEFIGLRYKKAYSKDLFNLGIFWEPAVYMSNALEIEFIKQIMQSK